MYKLFLCLRYLRRRRIAFFAVAAVCLCVAMVLIVVSVMGGFLQMVKDRSRGMLSDLVAENGALQGFPHYEEFIHRVKTELPEAVFEATPVIITYGVLRFPIDQITKPVQIVGINLDETYRVNEFKNGLFYEKYYPATTTLGPQKEPAYGYEKVAAQNTPLGFELGRAVLPQDLESAYQSWLTQNRGKRKIDIPIDRRMEYERPGYYRRIPRERLPLAPAPDWLEPERPGIVIGTDLCARPLETGGYERYYWRGTEVSLTFVPFSASGKPLTATGMPSRLFRYTDDGRTGIYDIDSTSVYVDFTLLQDVVEMDPQPLGEDDGGGTSPARTTQVQIKLQPGIDPQTARNAVVQIWRQIKEKHLAETDEPGLLEQVRVQTWEEKQARFIAAVEKEKVLVTVLFGVISVVAVFLVGCIFYMIVQQKTRDIGIVKSVGATSRGVAWIFLSYGAAVGVVGGAVGVLLGTLFVWYINEVQDLLVWINPSLRIWSPDVYSFDRIPSLVKGFDVIVIYFIAIIASMIGSVIAAWRAARIWPVESLRYE